jgi:magnesium chelatase family protein
MHVEVPAVHEAELFSTEPGESTAAVRDRVVSAREIQTRRQGFPNSRLTGRESEERSHLDGEGRRLLRDAISRLQLSARAHHRVLKVARTIADLDRSGNVLVQHIAESVRYRSTAREPGFPGVSFPNRGTADPR